MKLLFLETLESGDPFLEPSYNEVQGNRLEHLTLRIFEDFSDLLNYYDFVSTYNSGDFVINSFDSEDLEEFVLGLAKKVRLLHNSYLEVKKCTMEDNEFPKTKEIIFVSNPSVN